MQPALVKNNTEPSIPCVGYALSSVLKTSTLAVALSSLLSIYTTGVGVEILIISAESMNILAEPTSAEMKSIEEHTSYNVADSLLLIRISTIDTSDTPIVGWVCTLL